ncbi:hypothetical protein FRZ67_06795 [Panacibacter ginsenosidivorans]|uniref:PH domain-containing protein n=1 Tax=Panacibacter ginsenosidivorans TaxID=1813871 RepID=A0A5B8V796_9BACT|nr:hypothetical protein [Panacibacter ginsenosidivorans]QEC67015.1 hypothetical protein FRZ67_06795 [Panacibacter ginsenosidivorans]
MQRQKLSQRTIFSGIILLLFGILSSFFFIRNVDIKEDGTIGLIFLFLLFGLLLVALGIYFVFDSTLLEFDEESLYIINRNETQQIPLANIYKIKRTAFNINYSKFWKIGYKDNEGIDKTIRFMPKLFNNALTNFQQKVKMHNPDVYIKKWTWSFDFDQ